MVYVGRNRETRSTAIVLLLVVVSAITISAVTRFVDFSNSPLTWTHAGPTQGKRAYATPETITPVAPVLLVVIIPSKALGIEQPLPLQAFQHNLYNRPPPCA